MRNPNLVGEPKVFQIRRKQGGFTVTCTQSDDHTETLTDEDRQKSKEKRDKLRV